MLTWKEIIARIAQRIADMVMGLVGLPVRALGVGAAILGEAWRLSRQTEEQHHEQADTDDDETRALLRQLAELQAASLTLPPLPEAHKETKPAKPGARRVCSATEDPEGSPAPAVPPAPASRAVDRRPTAEPRRRYPFVRCEPDPDDADANILRPMLPVLR